MQIKKRLQTERAKVEYGCVDKENQGIVYTSFKIKVKPKYDDDWDSLIPKFKKGVKYGIKEIINNNEIFDSQTIVDINTFTERIMANKKSLFTIDVYLRQRDPIHMIDEIDTEILSIIHQIEQMYVSELKSVGL